MVTCHSNVSIFAVRSEIMACDITMLFTATDHSDIMISCGLFLDRYSPFLTEHCLGVSKFSLPVNGDNDMPVVGKHIASILHQILHAADCNRWTTEGSLPRCPRPEYSKRVSGGASCSCPGAAWEGQSCCGDGRLGREHGPASHCPGQAHAHKHWRDRHRRIESCPCRKRTCDCTCRRNSVIHEERRSSTRGGEEKHTGVGSSEGRGGRQGGVATARGRGSSFAQGGSDSCPEGAERVGEGYPEGCGQDASSEDEGR